MSEKDQTALKSFVGDAEGSVYFRHKDFYILLSVKRVKAAKEVLNYTKKYRLDKPATSYSIKSLGFKIEVSDDRVDLLEYPNHPMTVGQSSYVYNVKRSKVSTSHIFIVGLRVSYADRPIKIDFDTKLNMEAAFRAYEYGVEQCRIQLKTEITRIYSDASEKVLRYTKDKNTVEEKPKKRTMVRFKPRS